MILLLALVVGGLSYLVAQHWANIQNQLMQLKNIGEEEPHTRNRLLRYIKQENQENLIAQPENRNNENNSRAVNNQVPRHDLNISGPRLSAKPEILKLRD
jgi:hypothetical protein